MRKLLVILSAGIFCFFTSSSNIESHKNNWVNQGGSLPDLQITKVEAEGGYCKGWNTINVHVKAANTAMDFSKIPLTLNVDCGGDSHSYEMQINGPGMSLIGGKIFVFENVQIGGSNCYLKAIVNDNKTLPEVTYKNNEVKVKRYILRSCTERRDD